MFYSVYKGLTPGIYTTWDECKKNINGFKGAKYKKFDNMLDAKEFFKKGISQNSINGSIEKFVNIQGNVDIKKDILYIYTDGSCYGNGSEICYGGYGGFFGDNDSRNFCKHILGKSTNNMAELMAILNVFKILYTEINNGDTIHIYTDSDYAIKCFTTYGDKLYKKDCFHDKSPPNIELIKEGYFMVKSHPNIHFKHIYSHTGKTDIHSISNEKADKLANLGMIQSIKLSNNSGLNPIKFGQYKGELIHNIADKDLDYLKWILKNNSGDKDKAFIYILQEYMNNV